MNQVRRESVSKTTLFLKKLTRDGDMYETQ